MGGALVPRRAGSLCVASGAPAKEPGYQCYGLGPTPQLPARGIAALILEGAERQPDSAIRQFARHTTSRRPETYTAYCDGPSRAASTSRYAANVPPTFCSIPKTAARE